MDSMSSVNIVPDEIPDRNGALDSLANLASYQTSAVKESSGNDTVDGESGSSSESEDDSKRRQKNLDDIADLTLMSKFLNRNETVSSIIESSIGRKQYECRKCGQPLKGHVCSVKLGRRGSDVQKSHLLHRRFRWRSKATSDDESTSLVTMKNDGDGIWHSDDESSWEEDRDTREIWSKKNHNNTTSSGGRRLGSDVLRNKKAKRRRLSLSSDHDAARASTPALLFEEKSQAYLSNTGRRVYLCRKCGVPRKGHICQNDSVQSRKESSTESFTPAHALTEEIRLYLLENSRSLDGGNVFHSQRVDTDTKLLQCWAADVADKFSFVKDPSEKKIHRINKRKILTKRVNKERDSLIDLRSKIRQIQNDCRILEERIAEVRQENSAFVGASNFLNAIDTLR